MFILLFLLWCSGLSTNFAAKNNILFVIVDDLKPTLRCYGNKEVYTPNIDKLASKSFLFERTYTQQTLCAPSRNSLLTSRRPDTLHLYDFYNYWRSFTGNFTTLPQHFKENGYHTYSIGKVFHPGVSSNFNDDFPLSWSEKAFHPKSDIYKNAKVCLNEDWSKTNNLICPVLVEEQPLGTLPDIESLNEAKSFIRNRRNNSQPFFLAVGFQKPHIPFKFPINYLDLYPLENISLPINRWRPSLLPDVAWNPWTDIRERDDMKKLDIQFPYGPILDDVIKKIIQAYYASTTYIDDLVGKLLDVVDDNTIVIFTSDHGWSLGEHGEFAKYSNFEEATRVPLLIHVPKLINKQIIIPNLVEMVDIFPTLVDLTQVSQPLLKCPVESNKSILCSEGDSMLPIMLAALNNDKKFRKPGKSAIFTQYPRPGLHPTLHPNSDKPNLTQIKIMGYSIVTQRHRYTEWVEFCSKNFSINWEKAYGKELYDHLIDPGENLNLADRADLENVQQELRKRLILGWRHA